MDETRRTAESRAIPLQNLAESHSHAGGHWRHPRHASDNPHYNNSFGGESVGEDDAGSTSQCFPQQQPHSSVLHEMNQAAEHRPRKLVLCFDGTGNKFHGDDSDSNILKIFRMLDRTADDQYHYYQPGIGTYVVSGDLSHTSTRARLRSWYMKAKDSAFGSSFDQHVVGGYRFLMRFYNPGDEIYIFGFSRGAYIARFLAEMLDFVGLLSHGNEEMVQFAWKSFSQWQCRRNDDSKAGKDKKKAMYAFMKGFRETFSRPVRRIQFLGLFDTVNSVPRFETAWMERSKFPYTARSSAKVIRHAVSIDERRAKFRQDLIYQSRRDASQKHRRPRQVLQDVHEKYSPFLQSSAAPASAPDSSASDPQDANGKLRGRRPSQLLGAADPADDCSEEVENPAPYRPRSRSRSRSSQPTRDDASEFSHTGLSHFHEDDDVEQNIKEVWFSGDHADIGGGWEITPGTKSASHVPLSWMVREAMRAGLIFDAAKVVAMGCSDVLENQWAPNLKDEPAPPIKPESGAPDADEAVDEAHGHLVPDIRINSREDATACGVSASEQDAAAMFPNNHSPRNVSVATAVTAAAAGSGTTKGKSRSGSWTPRAHFHHMMHKAHVAPIHDSLAFNHGLGPMAVLSWQIMEYMPFRRMDLQPDGSWKPIRWPLPRGEVRDAPDNVVVHGSVLRRMQHDPTYRPGNLIVGGGGRGCRVAPAHYGMGEWECVGEEGDPIGELWTRKARDA